jgi:hypothetical protein
MNKEQQELLDLAYKDYKNKTEIMMGHGFHGTLLSQEEFINKCKTDIEFSERWGLKIEERELSLEERHDIKEQYGFDCRKLAKPSIEQLDAANIPTKLITITYNDKTIESYE